MRASTILAAATTTGLGLLPPLAAAGLRPIRKDMLISPYAQLPFSDLPIRVADAGGHGFQHVQIPVACARCFPADPTRPRKNLQDGVLEFDFRITRTLGLDGDDGAQVNGFTVSDAAFPVRSGGDANVAGALRLFVAEEGQVAPEVALEGDVAFEEVWRNASHLVYGVQYNITKVGEVVPGAPAGFRLSYMRAPQNSVLRIEQGAGNIEGERYPFEKPELWVDVGTNEEGGASEHFAWRKELDWLNRMHAAVYPGWDQEFVNCKTTACRVNKIHTKVTKAYDECVVRVEHPDQFEGGVVPPGCYVLLAGYYGKRNIMWVGCAVVFAITQLLKRNLEGQRKKVEQEKQQEELDEQMLERNEDDIVSYMMEVEAKAKGATGAEPAPAAVVEEETVKARKGHQASEE
ncbi:uncharacterized protein BKCO1_5000071 [Diplodia corticola]|uniref:Uncharacterized protein n=1 Tax=Diplodia corticola TaxID=236234 RepID=A0A1J9QS92_9PEZI|nr:uncharacterized protein BKCO1_5000071 [Diplodia corticola]OJD31289.1 hypothetical protein BKCO1_5000071 [Diplodia corticola]